MLSLKLLPERVIDMVDASLAAGRTMLDGALTGTGLTSMADDDAPTRTHRTSRHRSGSRTRASGARCRARASSARRCVLLAGAGCLYGGRLLLERRPRRACCARGLEFRREWLDRRRASSAALGSAIAQALMDRRAASRHGASSPRSSAPLALGGWTFSTQALLPDFSRLSPIAGFEAHLRLARTRRAR